jgi:hypothetical protein
MLNAQKAAREQSGGLINVLIDPAAASAYRGQHLIEQFGGGPIFECAMGRLLAAVTDTYCSALADDPQLRRPYAQPPCC